MVNTEDGACKELSKYDVKGTCQIHILPGSRSRPWTCWALGHCVCHTRGLLAGGCARWPAASQLPGPWARVCP